MHAFGCYRPILVQAARASPVRSPRRRADGLLMHAARVMRSDQEQHDSQRFHDASSRMTGYASTGLADFGLDCMRRRYADQAQQGEGEVRVGNCSALAPRQPGQRCQTRPSQKQGLYRLAPTTFLAGADKSDAAGF